MLEVEAKTLRAAEAAPVTWRVSHQRSSQRQRTNPSAKNIRQAPMLPNPAISNAIRPEVLLMSANDHGRQKITRSASTSTPTMRSISTE